MKKQPFYKRVNVRKNKKQTESKMLAYGIKHEFIKDDKKIIAFYDADIKMFTESFTGMLINSRSQKNQAAAEAQIYNMFDTIFNFTERAKAVNNSVLALPEILSAEGVSNGI